MSNDDLGQFPTPSTTPTTSSPPIDPVATKPDESSLIEDINAPIPTQISNEPFSTPPTTPPTFEETPDEIPSMVTSTAEPTPVFTSQPTATPPVQEPVLEPAPATVPTPKGGSAFGSLIAIVLLLISGVALAITVFLFSQSQQLKRQLGEVTQTLEQQRTTITPTPTPTIIDFPTPTPTPESTESAVVVTPTPTPLATISATTVLPLAAASKALKVAINHLPNAQMIIIKTENATNPTLATTKYFFRQDLTTKKYFYVLITDGKEPEIVDKAIYVTPDNSIPSLNDLIQGNTLGIDLDSALKIATDLCTNNTCDHATVKGQYIKAGENVIWQLSIDPVDATKGTLVIQINAQTKEVLYKSAGF